MEEFLVTKDSLLQDLMERDRKYGQILMSFGLHCFGCPLTAFETVEQASMVHGIDLDYLLEKLNEDFEEWFIFLLQNFSSML